MRRTTAARKMSGRWIFLGPEKKVRNRQPMSGRRELYFPAAPEYQPQPQALR